VLMLLDYVQWLDGESSAIVGYARRSRPAGSRWWPRSDPATTTRRSTSPGCTTWRCPTR